MNKKNILTVGIIILAILILLYFKLFKANTAKDIFNKSINSIVELKASSEYGDCFGTAIIIDLSGRLVTNAHVITYKQKGKIIPYSVINVRFASDDKYYSAKLVKYNTKIDLAILKFEHVPNNIRSIPVGKSNGLDYGDQVYSIGNAMNYGISINKGIISMPSVTIEYDGKKRNVIQSDITITSGNSGGALLNSNGQLIGITSFRTNDTSGNIVYGLGYSIPINTVVKFINS